METCALGSGIENEKLGPRVGSDKDKDMGEEGIIWSWSLSFAGLPYDHLLVAQSHTTTLLLTTNAVSTDQTQKYVAMSHQ